MTADREGLCERRVLEADDNHRILVDCWYPEGDVRALVHVFHGLSEHATRYDRFARQCTAHGYVVVAHNHRGHGENCAPDRLGHYADDNGWNRVVNDAVQVQQDLVRRFPNLPLILFGHSMGSYIAQSFMLRHAENVSALVLSASTWPNRTQLRLGRLLATIAVWVSGPQKKSATLNKMGFGDFNERFAPNRTEFDWLSRDNTEVDKYVADPLCGVPSSNQLWKDLLGGLLEISSARSVARVPDIPILILGGELDPVGGSERLQALADAYRTNGHSRVTLNVYPNGRHEMLNETNRQDVTRDILNWFESAL
ncbi:MAG: alpha/beta hydrolase [Gammaproteobacteria bacterium]|nr:alpha/beta hydrolase [Gammaproteobacteria bacterium]